MTGQATLEGLVTERRAALQGDLSVLEQLSAGIVDFELFFEMVPGTGKKLAAMGDDNPFDEVAPVLAGE